MSSDNSETGKGEDLQYNNGSAELGVPKRGRNRPKRLIDEDSDDQFRSTMRNNKKARSYEENTSDNIPRRTVGRFQKKEKSIHANGEEDVEGYCRRSTRNRKQVKRFPAKEGEVKFLFIPIDETNNILNGISGITQEPAARRVSTRFGKPLRPYLRDRTSSASTRRTSNMLRKAPNVPKRKANARRATPTQPSNEATQMETVEPPIVLNNNVVNEAGNGNVGDVNVAVSLLNRMYFRYIFCNVM